MKILIHLLVFGVVSIGVCGCSFGQKYDERLEHADEIMEEFPDSALAILERVDTASLRSNDDVMLNWLLYAQARVKNDKDTIIDLAQKGVTNYFKSKKDIPHLIRALYYNARNSFICNDLPKATADATRSLELAEERKDTYWCARNSELIADMFERSYMFEEELHHRIDAYTYFTECGRELNRQWALLDLGVNYICLGDTTKYLEYLDSVVDLSNKNIENFKYRIVNGYAKSSLYIYFINIRDFDNASQYEKEVIDICSTYPDVASFCALADANSNRGNFEEAHAYIDKAGEIASCKQDTVYIYASLSQLYRYAGNLEKCDYYTMLVNKYQIQSVREFMKQSVAVEQRNIKQEELARARERELKLRMWIVIIVLAVAGIAAWALTYYRGRIKLKNAEIEKHAAEILAINEQLENERFSTGEVRTLLQRIYKNQWETIGRLMKRLNKIDPASRERDKILRKMEAELGKLSDPAGLRSLVEEIDRVYDGGISELSGEPFNLTTPETDMAALIVTEIDSATAAKLLGVNRNTFYTRRRRLLAKIAAAADTGATMPPVASILLALTQQADSPDFNDWLDE